MESLILRLTPMAILQECESDALKLVENLQVLIKGPYLKTSHKNNQKVSFILKLITNRLPTQFRKYVWSKGTTTAQCPKCLLEDETQEHMILCYLNNPSLQQGFYDWLIDACKIFGPRTAVHARSHLITDFDFKITGIPNKKNAPKYLWV